MTLQEICEAHPDEEFLKADGFDDAIIGYEPHTMCLVYDIQKMVSILVQGGMSEEDAIEHLEYNTLSAYVGEKTPLYVRTNI